MRAVRLEAFLLLATLLAIPSGPLRAATDVKVDFQLDTTDANGKPIRQDRSYWVYRPDGLSRDKPVPMVLVMQNAPATFLHGQADKAGFVVVSCQIKGHTTPSRSGFDDVDYATAVIDRVAKAENCNDAFMCGLSMAGHMTATYACERPGKLRAAAVIDEFMGLTTNIPKAPVPMIFFHGTADEAVPYTKVKDSVDTWCAANGLSRTAPVTFFLSSRSPGDQTQANWEGNFPVAFVTTVDSGHAWPPGAVEAMWAFFARFVTPAGPAPAITAQPVDNSQQAGQPATFQVSAVGEGPLAYQWQKNGADVPGATSRWYTTPPPGGEDDGARYRVVVSNRSGKATSREAALKVLPAPPGPRISVHPKDRSAVAGGAVTFSVQASGENLRYQWQKNGMDIAGATGASLAMPAAITADGGATFRVIVSDSSGRTTSCPATLAVMPAPGAPEITAHPERNRLLPGQTAVFSVTARSDTPMTYQWQRGHCTTNMVDIPGATAATYTKADVKESDAKALYRCIVTNAAGNATSATEILMLAPAGGASRPATSPTRPTKAE